MALFRSLRTVGTSLARHSAARPALGAEALAPAVPFALAQLRHMTSSKLFVGGLAWETDDSTLRDAFSSFGEVSEAKVIIDRVTGRSRGFGFVSFSSDEDAQSALAGMDGKFLGGRTIRVDFAQQREAGQRSNSPRSRGGYGQGSGYGGQGSGYGDQGGFGEGSQAPSEDPPRSSFGGSA